jgi:two-component system sensor histidine kinase CssS
MKKPKFKSLTMRIWTTFTAIILAIILGISVIYMVAYRKTSSQRCRTSRWPTTS